MLKIARALLSGLKGFWTVQGLVSVCIGIKLHKNTIAAIQLSFFTIWHQENRLHLLRSTTLSFEKAAKAWGPPIELWSSSYGDITCCFNCLTLSSVLSANFIGPQCKCNIPDYAQEGVWQRLSTCMDQLVRGTVAVWHLQRVLSKKRDPLTHILFQESLLENNAPLPLSYFWWIPLRVWVLPSYIFPFPDPRPWTLNPSSRK